MVPVPDEEPKDAVLEALWKRVVEAWDDEKTHGALIEHAMREQRLPEVAGRYRALADDPEKGAVAKKKLDAVVLAATQMLLAMKTPKPGKVPVSITLTAFAVSALLLAWLGWALWGHR
ncbi:MAG: hypothetical protein ABSE49_15110 [Polyangiaceae bacterium]